MTQDGIQAGERFVTGKSIILSYGVSASSLRKWANVGRIRVLWTPGGQRRYAASDVERILGSKGREPVRPMRSGIIYARVSSQKQRDAGDLDRQVQALVERYPGYEVLSEVGSGVNFGRQKFRALLERVQSGSVSTIAIAQRDRLCRLAFDLVEWICSRHSTQIVVLDDKDNPDSDDDTESLAADLLAITNVFVSRHHGRRRYRSGKVSRGIKETARGHEKEGSHQESGAVAEG